MTKDEMDVAITLATGERGNVLASERAAFIAGMCAAAKITRKISLDDHSGPTSYAEGKTDGLVSAELSILRIANELSKS